MKTAIALLCLSGNLTAAPCCAQRVIVRKQVAVPVQTVQTLFLVAPPSYYGQPSYTPPKPQQQASQAAESPDVLAILEKIAKGLQNLDERVAALESNGPPPVPTPAVPLVIEQQCGKCHTGNEPKGQFDLSMLSDPRKLALATGMVELGKMPRDDSGPVNLPAETRSQLLSALKGTEQ